MKRQDKAHGITEIQHDGDKQLWLVVKVQLDEASQVPIPCTNTNTHSVFSLQYKPGVQATELALAFPLPENIKSPPTARVCL